MLQVLAGRTWLDFQVSEQDERDVEPLRWRSLVVTIDQGSDGWCAGHFLTRKLGINALVIPDMSHRCWNDTCLAFKRASLWGIVYVFSKIASIDVGPWGSSRWWQESREALDVYHKAVDPKQCPLFLELCDRIKTDLGLDDMMAGDDMEHAVWERLRACFDHKAQRVAISRWFGWCDAMQEWLQLWHSKLLAYLHICLGEGWMKGSPLEKGTRLQAAKPADGEDQEKLATAADPAELQKLRKQCKNTMHLATSVLMDSDLKRMVSMMLALTSPVRAAFGKNNQDARDVAGARKYFVEQACGAGLRPVADTMRKLGDMETLCSVGFKFAGVDGVVRREAGHPECVAEDELAHKMGRLVLALTFERLRSAGSYKAVLVGVVSHFELAPSARNV